MLGMSTDVTVSENAPSAVREANRKRIFDAMKKGFAVAQNNAPEDRGTLKQSAFPPEERRNGVIEFGYTQPYAQAMEFGTEPYWPPAQPLVEWADRVLGDPGAGYAIQQKIAEQGVDPHPYVRPGRDAVKDYLNRNNLDKYLDDELGP